MPEALRFSLCTAIDATPRLYPELVLWTLCVRRFLPRERFNARVFVTADVPGDLAAWVASAGVEVQLFEPPVPGSPHCNKIAPHLAGTTDDYVVVTDADLYLLDDLSALFRSRRVRAAPNNHAVPPPEIFERILAASPLARPFRPGLALFAGAGNCRETHANNISAGIVAVPRERSREIAVLWRKWAGWLVEHRDLLEHWGTHVDQVAFALAMEEIEEDVEFLPAQANCVLQLLPTIRHLYGLHLTTGHIPQFADRFSDGGLVTDGLAPGASDTLARLNPVIGQAREVIEGLDSVRVQLHTFLNPKYRRD